MGQLTLPPVSSIYVDSSILIYTVETHARYWPSLQTLWEKAKSQTVTLITSELTILECLVGPIKKGDQLLVQAYSQIFNSSDLNFVPIERRILLHAAKLRAETPALRTPDALHAATAIESGCGAFLTNDAGFKKIPGLEAIIIGDSI
ncbi:MAG: PIN domain-containing protein [Thermoguttaceae bacterium]